MNLRQLRLPPARLSGPFDTDLHHLTPRTDLHIHAARRHNLSLSAVAIPANPNALALGLKSGAVEKSDLRDLADLIRLTLAPPASRHDQLSSFLKSHLSILRS